MTDWRRSFRATLFRTWLGAGLPDPRRFGDDHDRLRAHVSVAAPPGHEPGGPLDPGTLRSVAGFGHVVGVALADLLEVDGAARAASVGWCARFNLGISLVDWLLDEAKLDPADVAGLPAFAPLARGTAGGPAPRAPRAELAYLDALAGGLLAELAGVAGPPGAGEPRSALWPSLRRMLRAELAAGRGLDLAAPRRYLPSLRAKSVEPFRVMAERTALAGPAPARVALARRLGRAIGTCVWLADDADDLWRDLDAGHGNRFVAEAVLADRRVLAADDATVVDLALERVLRREGVAERLCAESVGRFAATLRRCPAGAARRERAAGLVGVALARWTG